MSISASDVKALREKTGAGMMDCKKALSEANGDTEKAIEILRKMGLKDVAKREGKVAAEGTIGVYSHAGDQIVAVVELNCETDFVARGDEFKEMARGLAMHVAAMDPKYVSIADIPAQVLDKEKEILLETLNEKQREMADKILPGKLTKFYEDNVILSQRYVRDEDKTVQQVIEELSARCGEKVTLRRIVRLQVGEGIEKVQANLAEEVAATIAGS